MGVAGVRFVLRKVRHAANPAPELNNLSYAQGNGTFRPFPAGPGRGEISLVDYAAPPRGGTIAGWVARPCVKGGLSMGQGRRIRTVGFPFGTPSRPGVHASPLQGRRPSRPNQQSRGSTFRRTVWRRFIPGKWPGLPPAEKLISPRCRFISYPRGGARSVGQRSIRETGRARRQMAGAVPHIDKSGGRSEVFKNDMSLSDPAERHPIVSLVLTRARRQR